MRESVHELSRFSRYHIFIIGQFQCKWNWPFLLFLLLTFYNIFIVWTTDDCKYQVNHIMIMWPHLEVSTWPKVNKMAANAGDIAVGRCRIWGLFVPRPLLRGGSRRGGQSDKAPLPWCLTLNLIRIGKVLLEGKTFLWNVNGRTYVRTDSRTPEPLYEVISAR